MVTSRVRKVRPQPGNPCEGRGSREATICSQTQTSAVRLNQTRRCQDIFVQNRVSDCSDDPPTSVSSAPPYLLRSVSLHSELKLGGPKCHLTARSHVQQRRRTSRRVPKETVLFTQTASLTRRLTTGSRSRRANGLCEPVRHRGALS